MRKSYSDLTRHIVAAAAISGLAMAAMLAGASAVKAADPPQGSAPVVAACAKPLERVILFDERGRPTPPARTPYFYCIVGEMLLPTDIPPPPEYCCR